MAVELEILERVEAQIRARALHESNCVTAVSDMNKPLSEVIALRRCAEALAAMLEEYETPGGHSSVCREPAPGYDRTDCCPISQARFALLLLEQARA